MRARGAWLRRWKRNSLRLSLPRRATKRKNQKRPPRRKPVRKKAEARLRFRQNGYAIDIQDKGARESLRAILCLVARCGFYPDRQLPAEFVVGASRAPRSSYLRHLRRIERSCDSRERLVSADNGERFLAIRQWRRAND